MAPKSTKESKAPSRPKPLKVKTREHDGCCKYMVQYVTFIIVVFGVTFLSLWKINYSSQYIFVSGAGELSTRHFVDDLNTILCENYEVTSWDPADVYLTSGKAKVDENGPRTVVTRQDEQLYPNNFQADNVFYLLEGSNIKVNVCRRHESTDPYVYIVDLLIFKGDDSWKKWKSGSCNDCPVKNITLSTNAYCDDGRETVLKYNVDDRDSYYVAVVKRSKGYFTTFLNVNAELTIGQTTFDIRNAKKVCSKTKECLVPLKYASDVDIVLKVPDNPFVTTDCQFRVLFCLGIFVIFPACLISLAFCCCAAVVISEKRSKRNREQNQQITSEQVSVQDKAGLVDNELPPSYSSINPV